MFQWQTGSQLQSAEKESNIRSLKVKEKSVFSLGKHNEGDRPTVGDKAADMMFLQLMDDVSSTSWMTFRQLV
jgi:hypothetical protein